MEPIGRTNPFREAVCLLRGYTFEVLNGAPKHYTEAKPPQMARTLQPVIHYKQGEASASSEDGAPCAMEDQGAWRKMI